MLTKAIAIIDDEADLVNLFSEALRLNGFNLCGFTDPLDALVQFERDPVKYGLVICDFKMPIMDGNTLCTELIKHNSEMKIYVSRHIENGGQKNIQLNKHLDTIISKKQKDGKDVHLINAFKNFDQSLHLESSWHPTHKGYDIMAENWYQAIKDIFKYN